MASSQCGVLMKNSSVSEAGTSSMRKGTIGIPRDTARSTSRFTCVETLAWPE